MQSPSTSVAHGHWIADALTSSFHPAREAPRETGGGTWSTFRTLRHILFEIPNRALGHPIFVERVTGCRRRLTKVLECQAPVHEGTPIVVGILIDVPSYAGCFEE
jgi:hypothetical protein